MSYQPPRSNYYQPAPVHYGQPVQPPVNHSTYAPVVNQPQVQSTNIVVNAGGMQTQRKRDWSTPLCGCCEDVGNCMCVLFFGCFHPFMLSTRLEEIVCLPCLVPQSLMALRIKLRESNNIAGSIFMDCFTTTCCPHLSICQMIREMDNIDRNKPGTKL